MGRWSFALSLPVLVLSLGVLVSGSWLCWLTWKRNGPRKLLTGLEGLRWLVIALGVFTLWRPEWLRRSHTEDQPEVIVLCDASRSMDTKDVLTGETLLLSRAEWLRAQRDTEFWKPLAGQYKISVVDFSPATTNAGAEGGTDINQALDDALARHRNVRAVLLLSDGDWTAGKSPVSAATKLRLANVPVFTVAVGNEKFLPDIELTRVAAPAYGLFGEQVFIPFTISSHLPRDVRTTVTLQGPDGVEATKEVSLPALGQLQDAIVWSPQREGVSTLLLKLPVEKDELRDDNNAQTFQVSIRRELLKVLVVDSLPRWEYRFLRNALMRDPGVDVKCLLLHPGMEPASGRDYLPAFPDSKEALTPYDVVFLGDIGIGSGELSLADAERLKGLVEQQGSGLVFLPGRRGRELSFINSPLESLLPVVLEENRPEGYSSSTPSALALTQSGRGHLLTMLAASEDQNAQLWRRLDGFYWHAAVEKSRPGAEVLAVHAERRNQWGRVPLLVTRQQGNGKVLFMGTDSAWRWRRGVEDVYHYRFWGQVVRWMSYQRHLAQDKGIRVFFNPDRPQRGETVFVHATVFNAAGLPLERGTVHAEIVSPGKRAEQLALTPLAGGWGVFEGRFVPEQTGAYAIKVVCEDAGRELQSELLVGGGQREEIGRPARSDVLQEIAQITQGEFGSLDKLPAFVARISALPEKEPAEQRVRLWCHPVWGGLIVTLLAVYWIGRKMAGLV
jgi:hypothetical protein